MRSDFVTLAPAVEIRVLSKDLKRHAWRILGAILRSELCDLGLLTLLVVGRSADSTDSSDCASDSSEMVVVLLRLYSWIISIAWGVAIATV